MPAKRKLRTRVPVPGCRPDEWRLMLDMEPENRFRRHDGVSRETWDQHKEAVLAEWTRLHPGTRPSHWWRYEAPQELVPGCKGSEVWAYAAQRQRLGGKGDPAWLHLRLVPCFNRGIPANWISREAGFQSKDRQFIEASVDPSNPPTFEGEAQYLLRHQFFLDGERQRTPRELFEPVQITTGSAFEDTLVSARSRSSR